MAYGVYSMKRLVALLVALMLGSGALAQKVWRDIEVTHNCLEAEALLRSYDDVTLIKDCRGQTYGIVEGTVSWLFDTSNVAFSISFLGSTGDQDRFSFLRYEPPYKTEDFIRAAQRSLTVAYGSPTNDLSTSSNGALVSGAIFWKRSDGIQAHLWVSPGNRDRYVQIIFVPNDADQF